MSDPRIERVREILDLAMERPSAEREAFVAGAAGSDVATRNEVLSLIAALDGRPDVLEPPAVAGESRLPPESLTGLTFGAYEVRARIGAGGMGVVYEAHDTRLGRTVAVKALPPAFARDPHRRARLEQEARLLASLNHPNIAAIHGVEDTPRGPVLVLEFVPGRTLADELAHRALPIDEALAIATQIARGLEAAHAAGIVHRDLKPANIKLTHDGVAKILDFGVAKISAETLGPAAVATEPGMIVGSAAYMSPEQARGRPVDRRADLWAFGCVVYEMLAGRRAFAAQTSSDTLAAILTGQPDWTLLPAQTPPAVRRLLTRCMEKDPQRRQRDAGDAALDLDAAAEEPAPVPTRTRAPWLLIGVLALLGAAALAAFRPWQTHIPIPPPARTAFSLDLPGPLATEFSGGCLAITPDARTLVYAAYDARGHRALYRRDLSALDAVLIAGTENAHAPFVSPDGQWIGYLRGLPNESSMLMRLPLDGGPPQRIGDPPVMAALSATWGDDGTLVFVVAPGTLDRVPVAGGKVVPAIPKPDTAEELHAQPEFLPGSRAILFTCWRKEAARWRPRIEVADLAGGPRRVLMNDATMPRFARDARMLLYGAGSEIMAVEFDPQRAVIVGKPRVVLGSPGGNPGPYVRCALSAAGTLAYVPGDAPGESTDLAWFRADGTNQTVLAGDANIWTLRLSPDAARVAYTIDPLPGMWVLDLNRGNASKLFTPGRPDFPVWTPDGWHIAFETVDDAGAHSVVWIPSDGSGKPETLYTPPHGEDCTPTGFSPDGRFLLVMVETGPKDVSDVFLLDVAGDRAAKRLFPSAANRAAARFSPDGSLLAYSSNETGRPEIYVQSYPSLEGKHLVSVDGGERPTWSADGKRLFWRIHNAIYSADISSEGPLHVGLPRIVLKDLPGLRYDTAPDGDRFIMARPRGQWGPQSRINIILNALSPEPAPAADHPG